MSAREVLTSPPSPGKRLQRSIQNQTSPNSKHDSLGRSLSLRRINLTASSLPAIINQCGTRANFVTSLDISYSLTDETTLKILCASLNQLETLVAVECGLSHIDDERTHWPRHLKTIDLSRNNLNSIPSGLNGLFELTELNLSGNEIISVDPAILTLPRLQKIHLLNNPIENVPKSVCREGVCGLRKFFNVSPMCLPLSAEETNLTPFSKNLTDRHLDLRRYVLHDQGSVESGYESSQRALSNSNCCSISSLSDVDSIDMVEEEWLHFGHENLPDGYAEATQGQSPLCKVYLPDGCIADIQIEIVKDLSLHPKVQPNELLISPVVRITPHGISFPGDKPAIIVLTHCTKPNNRSSLQVIPLCSDTASNQSTQWNKITPSEKSQIFQSCVMFSTTHFSLFAVVASIPYPSTSVSISTNAIETLEIPDLPGFKAEFPRNGVISPTTIRATSYFTDQPYAIENPERSLASACVGIEPHGIQFEHPVTVSLPIPDYAPIKELFPNASLQLYHAPSKEMANLQMKWEPSENQNPTISNENGVTIATFTATHFSFFEFLWSICRESMQKLGLGASHVYRHLLSRAHFVSVRWQAFMTPPLCNLSFGLAVCLYKFGDPLTELSNYPWIVADSGPKGVFFRVGDLQVTLRGCFTADQNVGDSLIQNATIDFRGEDVCIRFDFALRLSDGIALPITDDQVLGKLKFTQWNGNAPENKSYNLIKPNSITGPARSLGRTYSPLFNSTSNSGYMRNELTPPWSPDTDIQMECDDVFVNQPTSNSSSLNDQADVTQLPMFRGKHKRQDSLHSLSNTMQASRAKRKLFLRTDNISDKTLMEISQEACSKYVDLGIQLGLPFNAINSTVGGVGSVKPEHLKMFYVLQDWKGRAASELTFQVLARALEDVGLASVAQRFCYTDD